MDSPLSSNAENSHPQRSLGLAPSFQRSLSELSPRPRLAPASRLWLAKPNGGQGNKQEERQQSRSGIIARWQIQRARFWFLHFPRLGKPQSYMATKFGWERDWVFQSNSFIWCSLSTKLGQLCFAESALDTLGFVGSSLSWGTTLG